MTIQTLNNGAALLEQRTKINENFAELDTRTTDAQADATAAAQAAAGKYTKPGSGIPASDLTAAVQTSLGKADSAIQQAALDTALTAKADASATVSALASKAPAGSGVGGAVTKSDVGLSNVDNTSDASKPVSTAQAAAIAARAPIAPVIVAASRALVATDAGATLVNNSATAYALSLIPGLGSITLDQAGTGTLTVAAGTATLSGVTGTSGTQRLLRVVEESTGVYRGESISSPLLPTQTDLPTLIATYPAASNAGKTAQAGPLGSYRSDGIGWRPQPQSFVGLRSECGLFGDSIMERETTGPTGASYMGRSITAWTGFCAPTTTGPLLQPRYNDGVGGDTLDQIIARLPTAVGRDTDIVVYRGGTNSTTLLASEWAAKQQTIIGTLAAAKKLVIVKGIPPQNVTGTTYGARRQAIPTYNKITERICSQYANVIYIDEFKHLVESGWPNTGEGAPIGASTSGTAASGAVALVMAGNHDTLHPGDYGGVLAGIKAASELAGRLTTVPGETYGSNLITLAGTGGTNTAGSGSITGDTPYAGWTLNIVSGNAAIQLTRITNGFRLQCTAVSASAFLLTSPNLIGSVTQGQVMRHGGKLSLSNVSNITYVRQFLRSSGSDVSRAIDWESYVPPIGVNGWIRSVRYTVPTLTDLYYGLSCSMQAGSSINIDLVDPELFTVQ